MERAISEDFNEICAILTTFSEAVCEHIMTRDESELCDDVVNGNGLLDLDNVADQSLVLGGLDVVDSFVEVLGVDQCNARDVPSLDAIHLLH